MLQAKFCQKFWPYNLQCLGGGGGRGVTTDEKGVYIQIQNIIVSTKALVLVNCLNTFVHDCRLWGTLSPDVRYAKTLDAFKNKIRGCDVSLLVDDGCKGCSLCSS